MKERRTEKFMVALSPTEREALATLAEHCGVSSADVIRSLLWRAHDDMGKLTPAVIYRGAGVAVIGATSGAEMLPST